MIYRNTVQRAMTLEAVRRLHAHPTAEEVYRQVAAEHPSVSRATVYRNLRQLAESGLLLKINTTDGADHFDHRCDAHYHAGCLRCGRGFRRGAAAAAAAGEAAGGYPRLRGQRIRPAVSWRVPGMRRENIHIIRRAKRKGRKQI